MWSLWQPSFLIWYPPGQFQQQKKWETIFFSFFPYDPALVCWITQEPMGFRTNHSNPRMPPFLGIFWYFYGNYGLGWKGPINSPRTMPGRRKDEHEHDYEPGIVLRIKDQAHIIIIWSEYRLIIKIWWQEQLIKLGTQKGYTVTSKSVPMFWAL